MSSKAIAAHIANVDFCINDYLAAGYIEKDVVQGCYEVSGFLGDWFIHKATWSSLRASASNGNAASFKKFYI